MKPAARVQAAIEILDRVIDAARRNGPAADTVIADWIRAHRYAGSKDKRAIREHVYTAIRAFGDVPPDGRSAMVTLLGDDPELFDGSPYGPTPIDADEQRLARSLLPDWLSELIPAAERHALLERAPLDLRINRLKADRATVMPEFDGAEAIAGLPDAIRLRENVRIEQHPAWIEGRVEVQDAGSQWVAEACRARSGETVVDLCAGAGGKTLALAAAMGGEGSLIACDTSRDRLQRLPARAERAGADGIATILLNPGEEVQQLVSLSAAADIVLVDAPCSGSGTLRRNPEARWRLTPDRLGRLTELQAQVLEIGKVLVKPGGHLVYAVCSLIEAEGAGQIDAFLARNPDWEAEALDGFPGRSQGVGRYLTPAHDATDGFFVARLARRC